MELSDFNYELNKSFIAQKPLEKRDESRLLVYDSKIRHKKFRDIAGFLKKGDVLVVNESKVKRVRLNGMKSTGSPAEVILLENLGNNCFRAKIKTKSPKKGNVILFKGFSCSVYDSKKDDYFVKFDSINLKTAHVPLPAYVRANVQDSRYQTVYSSKEGSYAAPTAGLHFTKELIEKIKNKGVKIAKVCLHIDFGTFLPINEEDFTKHMIHSEYFEISKKAAKTINERKGRLFVVGTTSLRAIESGFKNRVVPCRKRTSLFIYPGYAFKNRIDALITNFHLPKSSLLLLVSAFIGREKVLMLYETAKKNNYRFYSFGDAMLLFNENSHPQ